MPDDVTKTLAKTQGEETIGFFKKAPEIMKELTAQMIDHKDIRVRERIRAQIKGIFAMILADTEYPDEAEALPEDKKDRIDDVL